jgi:hypothetical protein
VEVARLKCHTSHGRDDRASIEGLDINVLDGFREVILLDEHWRGPFLG